MFAGALGAGPKMPPVTAQDPDRSRDVAARSFWMGYPAWTTRAKPGEQAAVVGKWSGCEDCTLKSYEGHNAFQEQGMLKASAQTKLPSPTA